MAINVRRQPPVPPAPEYARAAELIAEKVGGHLTASVSFPPRSLALEVDPAGLREVALFLRDEPGLAFSFLSLVSGVDMEDHIQVVYHCHSLANGLTAQLRVRLDRAAPEVDSLVPVWPTANWLERETYDLVGVRFTDHPDPRRILMSEDYEGYPLRKDYLPPAYQGRVKA